MYNKEREKGLFNFRYQTKKDVPGWVLGRRRLGKVEIWDTSAKIRALILMAVRKPEKARVLFQKPSSEVFRVRAEGERKVNADLKWLAERIGGGGKRVKGAY